MDLPALFESARPVLVAFGLKVLGALAVYIIGRKLIGLASRLVTRVLDRQHVDPTITRYQERHQQMLAFSAGATFVRWRNTAFEIGVLRNSYDEETGFDNSGPTYSRVTYYDAYAGLRVNLFRQR